jgi:hypothetical protein
MSRSAWRPNLQAMIVRRRSSTPTWRLVYRQKVERLGDALHDAQHGREAFELVRSLIREVRLIPADGTLLLELEGDLAGIVAISENAKPGQEPGAKALQIKMVAGARNSRELTLACQI